MSSSRERAEALMEQLRPKGRAMGEEALRNRDLTGLLNAELLVRDSYSLDNVAWVFDLGSDYDRYSADDYISDRLKETQHGETATAALELYGSLPAGNTALALKQTSDGKYVALGRFPKGTKILHPNWRDREGYVYLDSPKEEYVLFVPTSGCTKRACELLTQLNEQTHTRDPLGVNDVQNELSGGEVLTVLQFSGTTAREAWDYLHAGVAGVFDNSSSGEDIQRYRIPSEMFR
ncbi:MAG: hypothetical protein OXR66_03710 [Candidatus Woesearchaeota archaeon]|nr:hypothetical protein [Candidatus Woesearchaeota archaeon]